MQSVCFQQKPLAVYMFARTYCYNVRGVSGPEFWWGSWGWRRLYCILLNFFINNLDGLASLCKHREIGLSLNFSLHYYASNQYANLYSPLALGESCTKRNLYSECCLVVILWERGWELGLARRQRHFNCGCYQAFLLGTPLSQHNWCFWLKSRQECPGTCLHRCTVCLWWSFASCLDILPPSGALALLPTLILLVVSQSTANWHLCWC